MSLLDWMWTATPPKNHSLATLPETPGLFERAGFVMPGSKANSSPSRQAPETPASAARSQESSTPAVVEEQAGRKKASAQPPLRTGLSQSVLAPRTLTSKSFPKRPSPGGAATERSPTRTPGSSSLFDRYVASEPLANRVHNPPTNASRLRAQGIRVPCYLNGETAKSAARMVAVPETVSTLREMLDVVQVQMRLDSKLMYARDLYMPNGDSIRTYEELRERAASSTPMIIGCGEPFDPTCIPPSMLMAFQRGGGRKANSDIKRELLERKRRAAHLKADQVRSGGHGANNSAARSARDKCADKRRLVAAQLRHEQLTLAMRRAEEHDLFLQEVRVRSENSRTELAQRSERVAVLRGDIVPDESTQRRSLAAQREALSPYRAS